MSENESAANLMAELERELGVKGHAAVLRAALKIAKEAAAEAKEVEPPTPPAWMVEVTREAAKTLCVDGCGDAVEACQQALRLALERGHVVERTTVERDDVKCRCVGRQGPNPECGACGGSGCVTADVPRDWAEEALLKAAREDAAQIYHDRGMPMMATEVRAGMRDDDWAVLTAIQARRNMLREGAVAVALAAPVRDRDGDPPAYAPGDHVQKCTGDYRIGGIVRGVILTGAGLWRYAVEHQAEGGGAFLHIYAAANLSSTLPTREA